jgi:hypothetical protein
MKQLTELELYEITALLGQLDRYAIERNRAIIDLACFRRIPVQQLMEELSAHGGELLPSSEERD